MATTNLAKAKQGYGYKYTELAQINDYLESINTRYYQYVESLDGTDYIYTVPIVDGKELPARRGCRIVSAPLSGKSNPAQEMGAAITYARRYSLLMAFGLATEDDDAQSLTVEIKKIKPNEAKALGQTLLANKVNIEKTLELYKVSKLEDLTETQYVEIMQKLKAHKGV